MSVARILICSDFLVTSETEQYNNRRWLKDLIHRPILMATGMKSETFSSTLTNPSGFSRAEFMKRSGINFDFNSKQGWFSPEQVSSESLAYLGSFLSSDDFLIGYELSESTRQTLDRAGIRYMDIWLHPIRFLDDILFGFFSNVPKVHQKIGEFNLPEEHFWLYADRLKIQNYKGWDRKEFGLKNGSALFIGQTLVDKAVCDQGKFLNALDFKSEIENLAAKHTCLYYSRHPHVKNGDENILKWLKTVPKVELLDAPTYRVLADSAIKVVAGISSSAVLEARYFGKETRLLFKPVIQHGKGKNKYASIYQEFVSPHFWSAVLSPVTSVRDCPRVLFLDGKDKLRDMLAFYWSYPQIDKQEAMRVKLQAVANAQQKMKTMTGTMQIAALSPSSKNVAADVPVSPGESEQSVIKRFKLAMRDAKVVSFDVFDTLVQRPFDRADAIFEHMAPRANAILGYRADFISLRKNSRNLAKNLARNEEVLLSDRYTMIAQAAGGSLADAKALLQLELDSELELLSPKPIGQLLFRLARESGKRVILVSDTYFDQAFVTRILEKNGFSGYERLFCSSEAGLLKATGNLYPFVTEQIGTDKVLHVGDNAHVDRTQAERAGWKAFYVPSSWDSFCQRTLAAQQLKFADAYTHHLIRGLAANRLMKNPFGLPTPSFAGGSMRELGYTLIGPMMGAFAAWVLQRAMQEGIKELFFLARDGWIVKQCYDRLASQVPGAPRATYLYASRRSVNVAAIRTLAEAQALLAVNWSPTPVEELLAARFGLAAVSKEALEAAGLQLAQTVSFKTDRAKVEKLVEILWPQLSAQIEEERALLSQYYREQGLFGQVPAAIVDIGHNGTMQLALARLTGRSLGGYYFATYSGISDVEKAGLAAAGFVGERLNGKAADHPYCRNILMFELMFLNQEGSFVRMEQKDGKLRPLMLPLTGEESRVKFIGEVYSGVLDFTADVVQVLGPQVERLSITGAEAIAAYVALLEAPTQAEAQLFEGIVFENVYSGRKVRHVLAPGRSQDAVAGSIWQKGAEVVCSKQVVSNGNTVKRLARWTLRHFVSERKLRKFDQDPRQFWLDAKFVPLRRLAKFV